jgi:hypothetical protein
LPAWSLVSDSAAWSLRPGHFAFDVPQVTEAGRLRCWFTPFGNGLGCSVQEVREEVPGQVMSLRSRSTQQAGRRVFTLSVQLHDRGAMVRLTVTVTGSREDKADFQAFWRKQLKAWLSALTAVAEGRQPWLRRASRPCAARKLDRAATPAGCGASQVTGLARRAHAVHPAPPPGPGLSRDTRTFRASVAGCHPVVSICSRRFRSGGRLGASPTP